MDIPDILKVEAGIVTSHFSTCTKTRAKKFANQFCDV